MTLYHIIEATGSFSCSFSGSQLSVEKKEKGNNNKNNNHNNNGTILEKPIRKAAANFHFVIVSPECSFPDQGSQRIADGGLGSTSTPDGITVE